MLNNESKIGKFLQIIRHQPLGLTLFFVIVFIIFIGFFFERNLALLIDQHRAYLFIDTFRTITVIGDATWWLVIFVIGLSVSLLGPQLPILEKHEEKFKRYKSIFLYLILSCVVSGILHHIIKIIVGRYRPRYLFTEDLYGFSPFNFDIAMNSFPSGHSQTIFSICVALSIIYPRHLILFLLLAIMVGVSRIMILAHFPSDVIFGAYLGIVTAILLNRYYFRVLLSKQK